MTFVKNLNFQVCRGLSPVEVSKESISKILIGNRIHTKLRIFSPEKLQAKFSGDETVVYELGCRGCKRHPKVLVCRKFGQCLFLRKNVSTYFDNTGEIIFLFLSVGYK